MTDRINGKVNSQRLTAMFIMYISRHSCSYYNKLKVDNQDHDKLVNVDSLV